MRIGAVPSNKLETVKDWLTSCNIKYYESKLNLAWKPILKSIVEDPKQFIAGGAAAGAAGAGPLLLLGWPPRLLPHLPARPRQPCAQGAVG